MIYHFTFDWPQVVVTVCVFISFVGSCFKSGRQEKPIDSIVVLVVGILWMIGSLYILSAGGFYG